MASLGLMDLVATVVVRTLLACHHSLQPSLCLIFCFFFCCFISTVVITRHCFNVWSGLSSMTCFQLLRINSFMFKDVVA